MSRMSARFVGRGLCMSAKDVYEMWKDMGIPLEYVVKACTITPAKSLGIDGEIGSLEVGKLADIVILNKELNIVDIIKDGKNILC